MELTLGYRPLARRDDLVITVLGGDLVIYDQRSHQLHQVSAIAAATWRLCDGTRTVPELAHALSLEPGQPATRQSILLLLAQLSDVGLLDTPLDPGLIPSRQDRRSLLRGALMAGAVAGPAIVSISAPRAAAASSSAIEDGDDSWGGDGDDWEGDDDGDWDDFP